MTIGTGGGTSVIRPGHVAHLDRLDRLPRARCAPRRLDRETAGASRYSTSHQGENRRSCRKEPGRINDKDQRPSFCFHRACVAPSPPPEVPPQDEAHARARAAVAHYAPAEPRALGAMAVVAALAIFWILVPVGLGILLGTLSAFTVYRPYRSLARRTSRPTAVAAAFSFVATLILAGTVAVLSYSLLRQGIEVASHLPRTLAPGGPASVLLQRLASPFALLRISPADLVARLRDALGEIATGLAGLAAQALGTLFDGMLALFFTAITMFFVLVHWVELARHAEHLMPINPHHTRRLLREVRRIGRTAVVGNLGTAVIQGVIAGVGYAIAHVPGAAFFGALTAIASLVPVLGTLLVWVPAGLVLVAEGHLGAGTFELVWGCVFIVMLCDYVVRPKLVAGAETMPTWLSFVAIFGGLKLFGFIGFVLGPLIVGVALATLRLYARTRRFRLGLR
jgi:predicted PurR-regulated permease PerM